MKVYQSVGTSLSMEEGVILNGAAIILPLSLRKRALEAAHVGHPGETAMRSILKQRVWWPGIKSDAIKTCKNCMSCTLTSQRNLPTPMTRRTLPTAPWEQLVIDHNGPYQKFGGIHVVVIVCCFFAIHGGGNSPVNGFQACRDSLNGTVQTARCSESHSQRQWLSIYWRRIH